MEIQTTKNKEISSNYWKAIWEQRDINIAKKLMADHMIYSAPKMTVEGRQQILEMIKRYMDAFSDSQIIIEDQIAEKDKVFTRATFNAIHSGSLGNLPPTHRKVHFQIMNLVQISDGKVTHEWEVYDQLGLMEQLGMELLPKEHVH